MYVMLLLGSILSAVLFGAFLREFTPGRLVQVVQAAAVATLVLNTLALWKQEARRPQRGAAPASRPAGGFRAAWAAHVERPGAQRLLLATGLGTVGFAMQDVLLEPYGAQVLGLGVGATTFLTGLLAAGGLAGFALASARPGGGRRAVHTAMLGAAAGALAFAAVALATGPEALPMFIAGVFAIGAGGGLFAHATLSLAMERAAPEQAGLALGAWGAVQATAAGFAVGAGGVLRDLLDTFAAAGEFGPAFTGIGTGYRFVYVTEAVLLVATLGVLVRVAGRRAAAEPPGGGAGEAPSSPRR
jgi:BCD family chlorophyll transporter-like MFS transporter